MFLNENMLLKLGCKAVDNLVQPNIQLGVSRKSTLVENGRYRQIGWQVDLFGSYMSKYCICSQYGELVYAFATRALSRGSLTILCCLKSSPGKGLLFFSTTSLEHRSLHRFRLGWIGYGSIVHFKISHFCGR